jgi:hypothetical protein
MVGRFFRSRLNGANKTSYLEARQERKARQERLKMIQASKPIECGLDDSSLEIWNPNFLESPQPYIPSSVDYSWDALYRGFEPQKIVTQVKTSKPKKVKPKKVKPTKVETSESEDEDGLSLMGIDSQFGIEENLNGQPSQSTIIEFLKSQNNKTKESGSFMQASDEFSESIDVVEAVIESSVPIQEESIVRSDPRAIPMQTQSRYFLMCGRASIPTPESVTNGFFTSISI